MTQKSTTSDHAAGCLNVGVVILFGLIGVSQAAGGIGALVWAVRAIFDEQNWHEAAAATAAAALFGSVGFGLLVAIWSARPRVRVPVGTDAPADEPWLGRADWASGKIPAIGGATVWAPVLAAVALWWNFASLPLLSVLPTFLAQVQNRWAWLVLAIPLIGALWIAAFLYQFFRALKFGDSVLELANVPGVVGGQLAGVVRIPCRVHAPEGFRVRLVCLESMYQSDRNRVSHVVWHDERVIKNPLVEGNETAVPVLLAIPYKQPETSRPDAKRDVEWRLEVWAQMHGIDYAATFEVPVYKTAQSRRDFQLDEKLVAQYAPPPPNELVLRDAGIIREPFGAGGVRLTFKAARNWRMALVVSLFPLLFGGFAFLTLLYNDEARDFFSIAPIWNRVADQLGLWNVAQAVFYTVVALASAAIFILITVYTFLVSLELWLYRSVVEADPAGLTFRGGLLGLGRQRRFPAENIQRFKLDVYMRSSGGGLWQSVVLLPKRRKDRKCTIAKGIASNLAVEAVIEELNTALGRAQ